MKTNLLLFTFILFGTALNAQTKSISTLTDSLANYTFYEYSDMGELHRNPDLWAVTSNLDSIATNNDLLMLLSHESEIVNCYAFHFLVSREEDMFDFLLSHLDDYRIITTRFNDIYSPKFMSDFYISQIKSELSTSQKNQLDSMLIFDEKSKLSYKTRLIRDLPAVRDYYDAIRSSVINGTESSLVSLARFNNKEDIDLILSFYVLDKNNFQVLKAIREFPDSVFYPKLTEKFEDKWTRELYYWTEWRMLFQALARYPLEPKTLEFFNRTLKGYSLDKVKKKERPRIQVINSNLICYLKVAIIKYPHPNFEPILKNIQLTEHFEKEVKSWLEMDK